jgi:predicted transcriptional regulator
MPNATDAGLARRERQIMDILYRRARATAAEVMGDLLGNPNYSTVRTQLRVLEEKGHVRHEKEGLRYVYLPSVSRRTARKTALTHLVDTFFDGSAAKVVAALMGNIASKPSDGDLARADACLTPNRNQFRTKRQHWASRSTVSPANVPIETRFR